MRKKKRLRAAAQETLKTSQLVTSVGCPQPSGPQHNDEGGTTTTRGSPHSTTKAHASVRQDRRKSLRLQSLVCRSIDRSVDGLGFLRAPRGRQPAAASGFSHGF